MKKIIILLLVTSGVMGQVQRANMTGLTRADVKLFLQYSREMMVNDTTDNTELETFQKACTAALRTRNNQFAINNVPARIIKHYSERLDSQIFDFEEVRRKRLQAERILKGWRVTDANLNALDESTKAQILEILK